MVLEVMQALLLNIPRRLVDVVIQGGRRYCNRTVFHSRAGLLVRKTEMQNGDAKRTLVATCTGN